jgi:hypothetical protein
MTVINKSNLRRNNFYYTKTGNKYSVTHNSITVPVDSVLFWTGHLQGWTTTNPLTTLMPKIILWEAFLLQLARTSPNCSTNKSYWLYSPNSFVQISQRTARWSCDCNLLNPCSVTISPKKFNRNKKKVSRKAGEAIWNNINNIKTLHDYWLTEQLSWLNTMITV